MTYRVLHFLAGASCLMGYGLCAEFPNCSRGQLASNGICNTTLSPIERAKALVSLLSQQEKIQNSQAESPGVSRIGLPSYTWWNEALHGVARSRGVKFTDRGDYSYATSFPQPLTMGAAFDMPMIALVADVISTEARAFSNGGRCGLNFWTPNINPYRDPRWGRGQEVPSEDAFFISEYVKRLIPGLQGGTKGDPYWKLVATCKHYAGYDIENWQGNKRYGFDAKITPQDLREYHMLPFQTCIRDVHAQSVMCAYNAVNGVPTCADPWLLKTLLRTHWNWTDGTGDKATQWVTSDCDSLANVYTDHRYKGLNAAQAAAISLNSGVDLDCGDFWPRNLGSALSSGATDQKTLDESLVRRYASLVRLGYFDPPEKQPYRQITFKDVATDAAKALALRAATEGIVLLKNAGGSTRTLPLDKAAVKTIAVLGPLASATTQMQGNYYGRAQAVISPAEGLRRAGFTVVSAGGGSITGGGSSSQAVDAVRRADAVVFVGGIDTSVEAEDKDRNDITWPSGQASLIKQLATAAAAAKKPFIVVQMGTMVDSTDLRDSPDVGALLWAGYPGQDGGTAIANILTGAAAPAGRLPVTQYPAAYTRQVRMTDMNLRPSGSSNPGRTYKWYTGTPVFEFGFGLHYTNFTMAITPPQPLPTAYTTSSLVASARSAGVRYPDLAPFASVPVTITNTGAVKSDFVVLGFLRGTFGPAPQPRKSLVAFARVHDVLPNGGRANATLEISLGSIARAAENGDLVLFPGTYRVELDLDGSVGWNFTISGEQVTLDSYPAR